MGMNKEWSPWRSSVVFGTAALFVFFQLVLQTFPSVMREGLVVDFSLNGAGFGGLSASFYYPYILLQIPAGLLVARFGARAVLLCGAILCTAACFIFASSTSADSAQATRIIMGIGAGPTVVCAMVLAAAWFPRRMFPMLVAVTEMAGMTGAAIGEEILGFIVEHQGWRAGMTACGIFSFVLLLLIGLFLKNRPPAGLSASPLPAGRVRIRDAAKLLLDPGILLRATAGGLVSTAGVSFGMLWGVPFLQAHLGFSLPTAALVMSFYFWGCLPGMLGFGWLCTRFHNPGRLLALGAVGTALSMMGILFGGGHFLALSVLTFLLGVFDSSYALSFTMVESHVPREHAGVALGLTNMMIMGIGGLVFQPLIGLAGHRHGLEVPDANALSLIVWAQAGAILLLALTLLEKPPAEESAKMDEETARSR